ncbi:hypothetical protein E8E14_001344 [Neopestalotiopsis sp. 37M]|nr:hypothetical protein E8E14_001344 [Neopestalotiopsis sp. 37M]
MIRSLRNRLKDLEKLNEWDAATVDINHHQPNAQHNLSRQGSPPTPAAASPAASHTTSNVNILPSTQTQGPVEPPNQSTPASAMDLSLIPYQNISVQYGSPPRCIEPHGFESLMRPINLAMKRSGDSESKAQDIGNRTTLTTSPSTASQSSSSGCACKKLLAGMRWSLPPRGRADALIAVYFQRTSRMTPVLHEPTFMNQYERLWESKSSSKSRAFADCPGFCKQKSLGALFPPTVHAVLAVGALFDTSSLEQNVTRAEAFFQLVQGFELFETLDNEVGIELVQLGLLMGIYLQSTERFSKCWIMSGLTIRMAQNMGLHFSISEARKRRLFVSPPTQLECEMRKRVWHACMLLETEVSILFGQSLAVPLGGTSISLPEAIDDTGLSLVVGTHNAQPEGVPSLIECFVHKIKLYDIMRQTLDRHRCNSWTSTQKATSDIQITVNLDTLVIAWHEQLPHYLQYEPNLESILPPRLATADANGISQRTLDLWAQAKRIHCRFLFVRQLILRPALEMLFEKQKDNKGKETNASIVGVSNVVLSGMAAQCLECTLSLVKLLGTNIESHEFTCWWDNISYLYTCATTILMGKNCHFQGGQISEKSLVSNWSMCLQYLSEYAKISSIAEKSSRLLQESAKQLHGKQVPVNPGEVYPKQLAVTEQPSTQHLPAIPLDNAEYGQNVQAPSHKNDQRSTDMVARNPGPEQVISHLDMLDHQLWDDDTTETLSWPFMPLISQLETFTANFDIS